MDGNMKMLVRVIVYGFLVLFISEIFGIVRFTYPKVKKIENTLKNPVKVVSIDGRNIKLEDGRILETHIKPNTLKYWIEQSDFKIDMENRSEPPGECFELFANNPRGLCGTCWSGIITIPIIPIFVTLKASRCSFAYGDVLHEHEN